MSSVINSTREPQIEVCLPTFYPAQVAAFRLYQTNRYTAVRCGRRWGKTDFGKTIAVDATIRGQNVCWCAPNYKYLSEAFVEIADILAPVKKQSSKIDGVIRTTTGGRIDFWTLENERAGSSRRYHLIIIDEAAFTKLNAMEIWERSLHPTLLDYQGKALVLSNANGSNKANFFYRLCTDKKYEFVEYHGPSWQNVHIPIRLPGESDVAHQIRREAEFEYLRATKDPRVFAQEYEAEFVDWSGKGLFDINNLLDDEKMPFELPNYCEYVFATVDSATKTGKLHDGTAVTYFAKCGEGDVTGKAVGRQLFVLDWDAVQITGNLLIEWIPSVFAILDRFAQICHARFGSIGVYIEDKSSGMILLQQAQRLGYPVEAIESKLTSVGKSERALNVSGHVYLKSVGIVEQAYNKEIVYHETLLNHWLSQFGEFCVGDIDPRAEDDLLDTATYGIAIALGDSRFGDA